MGWKTAHCALVLSEQEHKKLFDKISNFKILFAVNSLSFQCTILIPLSFAVQFLQFPCISKIVFKRFRKWHELVPTETSFCRLTFICFVQDGDWVKPLIVPSS